MTRASGAEILLTRGARRRRAAAKERSTELVIEAAAAGNPKSLRRMAKGTRKRA